MARNISRYLILAVAVTTFSPILAKSFTFLHSLSIWRWGVFSLASLWCLRWALVSWRERNKLEGKREARKALAKQRKQEVHKQCQEAKSSKSIVAMSLQNLVQDMKSGKLSVVNVMNAFQKEALDLTDRINCVTEPLIEASAHAKEMDRSTKLPNGFLYGVPISVKENISLIGYDSNVGVAKYADQLCSEDAIVIKVLKDHGAIPFVRTNVPQSLFSCSCRNPIFGMTRNPIDPRRSPGGSSGGEAALIGGGGSIIGLGSDVGGSLRTPAEYCGIYTLKPTQDRISSKGSFSLAPGNVVIRSVFGPMARDFDSLLMFCKALFSPKLYELDQRLPYLPFDEQKYNQTRPLRIGYYTFDGQTQCYPSNVRAVYEAKAALESKGHELVPFDFPALMGKAFPFMDIFARIMTPDRGERLKEKLTHSRVEPGIKRLIFVSNIPTWICQIMSRLLAAIDPVSSKICWAVTGFSTVKDYMLGIHELNLWRTHFLKVWQETKLDAVICPVCPFPAPTLEDAEHVTILNTYAPLFNCMNYPVGAMPVTKVTYEDVENALNPDLYCPNSKLERKILEGVKGTVGLNVGVQCAALPFKEELCLRVMRDLSHALQQLSAKN